MAAKPLTDEQCRAALEAVRKHGSVDRAARLTDISRGTLSHRYNEALRRFRKADFRPTNHQAAVFNRNEEHPEEGHSRGLPFEREWSTWMTEIGMVKDRYAGPAKKRAEIGRLKAVSGASPFVPPAK